MTEEENTRYIKNMVQWVANWQEEISNCDPSELNMLIQEVQYCFKVIDGLIEGYNIETEDTR